MANCRLPLCLVVVAVVDVVVVADIAVVFVVADVAVSPQSVAYFHK